MPLCGMQCERTAYQPDKQCNQCKVISIVTTRVMDKQGNVQERGKIEDERRVRSLFVQKKKEKKLAEK